MALPIKQQRFVDEFLIDMNGTQAAIRAGYSARSADVTASRLLANAKVQAYLSERRDDLQKTTQITQERVLLEFAKIAFFDPRKLFDRDGHLRPIHELDADTASVIAGLDVVSIGNDDTGEGQITKLKFNSRQAALDSIGRHLGMFKDKIEINGEIDLGATILAARRRIGLEHPPALEHQE